MTSDCWIAFSAIATLTLALAAFFTIVQTYISRKRDMKRSRMANSMGELCRWAEEALRLYYLPYGEHRDEIRSGLGVLVLKNISMVTHATILGEAFLGPTKRAEKAMASFHSMVYKMDKSGDFSIVDTPEGKSVLDKFESSFYHLVKLLYELQYLDYDYDDFKKEARKYGFLEPEKESW